MASQPGHGIDNIQAVGVWIGLVNYSLQLIDYCSVNRVEAGCSSSCTCCFLAWLLSLLSLSCKHKQYMTQLPPAMAYRQQAALAHPLPDKVGYVHGRGLPATDLIASCLGSIWKTTFLQVKEIENACAVIHGLWVIAMNNIIEGNPSYAPSQPETARYN